MIADKKDKKKNVCKNRPSQTYTNTDLPKEMIIQRNLNKK